MPELAKRSPQCFSILAFVGGGVHPAGLLNCMEGFSTFAARPLLNIHDCCVATAFRRQGISSQMLARESLSQRWRIPCNARVGSR